MFDLARDCCNSFQGNHVHSQDHQASLDLGRGLGLLAQAATAIKDRQDSYGAPAQDFERIAMMWEQIFDCPVSLRQVALAMIALKISREIHSHSRDNLVDIAGYAACAEAAAQEEEEEER